MTSISWCAARDSRSNVTIFWRENGALRSFRMFAPKSPSISAVSDPSKPRQAKALDFTKSAGGKDTQEIGEFFFRPAGCYNTHFSFQVGRCLLQAPTRIQASGQVSRK